MTTRDENLMSGRVYFLVNIVETHEQLRAEVELRQLAGKVYQAWRHHLPYVGMKEDIATLQDRVTALRGAS